MSMEKDALRKAAGLSFSTKKKTLFEGNISKVKTLDVETELLRIFSSTIRDIKRIRDLIEGRSSYPTNAEQFKLKDEAGNIDKKYLFKLSLEKLDLMEESLRDCFNIKEDDDKEEDEEEDEDREENNDEEW